MAPKNTETPGTASSTTVIDVSLRAALNGLVYARDVSDVPTNDASAIRAATVLNGAVSVVMAESLRTRDESANEDKNSAKILQAKPTADHLRKKSTGMKSGRKMIIKVDPPAENEKDSKSIPGLVFDRFSLQAVTEVDEERYQLHETFAENVLFLFGRRPRIWTLAGIVVNSDDANFADELIVNYDLYYRGTRVVDKQRRTFVFYEDVLIEGTLLGLTVSRNSQVPGAVNASITLVVHDRGLIGQDDGQDENLAAFLKRSAASLAGEKIEPDKIRDSKPDSLAMERAAAAAGETEANARVAELEKQLSDANGGYDDAFYENAAAEEAYEQALVDKALSTTPEALAEAEARKVSAEKTLTETESRMQEAAESIASLEQQVADEKKKLVDSAAKSDAQGSTAKAAAAAEGSRVGDVVVVSVSGSAVADNTLVDGKTMYEVSVTVRSGADKAETTRGGGDQIAVYEDPDQVVSLISSAYGISINRSHLLSGSEIGFSGSTEGRVL